MENNGILLSGIEGQLENIKKSVSALNEQVYNVNSKADSIERSVYQARQELALLTAQFNKMVADQQRVASLQKAITELVRVRQEIDQKYGNYSVVRETMLGVLQATDAALVKKNTIARVSEELMLSTPQYWLAPCLVAVSAWISNDRDLAERAINEAMKRDEEKTSLAMALICRRNGRIQTCYEWLSIYFSLQSASDITEETFTYIDAYVNGVFGPDEKHMCQGYVSKWIDEIRGNRSDFEAAQEKKWEEYCEQFRIDVRQTFPELATASPDFDAINMALGRIGSYGAIRKNFKGIKDAFVDQETMKKAVDSDLIHLVSNYDKSEINIRREEEYLCLVKAYDGDEEKAKKEMLAREARRQQHKLDFIEKMASEITSAGDVAPSKRRTAITFLSNYINRGYDNYIDKGRSRFPKIIKLKVDDWTGESEDGTESAALQKSYEEKMNAVREKALYDMGSAKPKRYLIVSIILLVAGVVGMLIPKIRALGVLALLSGVAFLIARARLIKNTDERIWEINREFDERIAEGKERLDTSLKQWRQAKSVVAEYEDNRDHTVA